MICGSTMVTMLRPTSLYPWLACMSLGLSHGSKGGDVSNSVDRLVCSRIYLKYCERCLICQQHNPGKIIQTTISMHPPPQEPFEALQIDFIHMPKCDGYDNILVHVDIFSNCPGVWACIKADSASVVKCLLKDKGWHSTEHQFRQG